MEKTEIIDGIKCYAPSLAKENDGFSSESFLRLFELEHTSFWFRSRNNLIKHLFHKYIGDRKAEVCEIGCGTGYVLKGLTSLKNLTLSGSEIYIEGLKYAKSRLPQVEFFQADATDLPFAEGYDAIGAFDVLEHISEDKKAMASIFKTLKPGGFFFITVPQYNWMWSLEDDIAFHKRRYGRKELRIKLEEAGFDVAYMGSFVFALFPVMAIQRFLGKRNRNKGITQAVDGFTIPSFINSVFYCLNQLDILFIKLGMSLPYGGSLVCVAKKRK